MVRLPTPRSTSLTTFTVRSGGQPLDGSVGVIAAEIRREFDRIPTAQLTLRDGDAAAQDFAVSAAEALRPGAEIEIDAGYDRDETRLFTGIVTRQRIEARRSGATLLHVEARHAAVALTRGRHSRSFADLSDADIITELFGGVGLEVAIATGPVEPQVVQHQATDWDFALQRAGTLGLLCDCDAGAVRFSAPDPGQPAAARFVFGQDLHRMELELDAVAPLARVEAGLWSPAEQALQTDMADSAWSGADAGTPDLPGVLDAEHAPRQPVSGTTAEAGALASADLARSRLAALRGTIEVQGTAAVAPGMMVDLAGLGARFNGAAFVSGVRHEIGRGDWMTVLQIGLDPRAHHERRPQAAAPAAGGRIPPVHGLQIGIVTALAGDPADEARIEVKLPTVGTGEGMLRARLAAIEAGDGRGAVFRPEIGDEVVLGFLDDDPRAPVILGALHSSAHPPPLEASDDNPEKGYVSRAGLRMIFDEAAPRVLIETPAGATLVLDDAGDAIELSDAHGNKLRMEPNAVALTAAGDLTLSAGGQISIEGINVEVSASAAATIAGSAGAELSSSGQTVVKGSVVMIN